MSRREAIIAACALTHHTINDVYKVNPVKVASVTYDGGNDRITRNDAKYIVEYIDRLRGPDFERKKG